MNAKHLCCALLLLLLMVVAQERLGVMSATLDRVGSTEAMGETKNMLQVEQLPDMTTPVQHMERLESKEEGEMEKAMEQMGSETEKELDSDKIMDRGSKEQQEADGDATQPTETETEMEAKDSKEAAGADVATVEMDKPKESAEVEAQTEPTAELDKPKESQETQDDATTEADKSPEAQQEIETEPTKAEEEHVTGADVEPTEAAQAAGVDYPNDEAAAATEAAEAVEAETAPTQSAAPTAAHVDIPAMPAVPAVPAVPAMASVCYSCSSYQNGSCLREPSERQNCPANAKQDGCYTLYKRETRLIMRGCSSDLKEEGNKYCLKEAKLCKLCRGQLCNRDVADVAAAAGQLLASLTVWCACLLATVLNGSYKAIGIGRRGNLNIESL